MCVPNTGLEQFFQRRVPVQRPQGGSAQAEALSALGNLGYAPGEAAGAVGNDTGPIHMTAAAGCPTVVLFSAASDPALTAPRGTEIEILQRDNLADLSVESVAAALRLR